MHRNWTIGIIAALAIGWSVPSLLAEESADQPKEKMLQGPRADRGERSDRKFDGGRRGPRDRAGRPGPQGPLHRALQQLDLTDEQKAAIRKVFEETQQANKQYRQDNVPKLQELREQLKAAHEAGDREKVKSLHEQMKAIHEGAPVPPAKHLENIKAQLTPEQREKLDAKLAEAREGMKDRRKERGMDDGDRPRRQRHKDGDKPARDKQLEL